MPKELKHRLRSFNLFPVARCRDANYSACLVTSALITAQHLANAAKARLLVAISFHFVPPRLVYLEQVLRSLAAFPVAHREIVVFTNTPHLAEQESILAIFLSAGLFPGRDARLSPQMALAHPFDLTWAHKPLISGDFLKPDGSYSHFVYLEDDEPLTFENFAYFVAVREMLRPFGNLSPGFLRTEWSTQRACLVNTDNFAPILLAGRPFIAQGDYAFVAADIPYWGGFILDRDLAREYIRSRSFDVKRSRAVSPEMSYYGVRERSAMGLTFENPPAPFHSRIIVPISLGSRQAPSCALLAHLPNNYANDPQHHLGKIAMIDLFAGKLDPDKEFTLASFKSRGQKIFRSAHCLRGNFDATRRGLVINILDRLRGIKRKVFGPARG
jgi:hypothetical protein